MTNLKTTAQARRARRAKKASDKEIEALELLLNELCVISNEKINHLTARTFIDAKVDELESKIEELKASR